MSNEVSVVSNGDDVLRWGRTEWGLPACLPGGSACRGCPTPPHTASAPQRSRAICAFRVLHLHRAQVRQKKRAWVTSKPATEAPCKTPSLIVYVTTVASTAKLIYARGVLGHLCHFVSLYWKEAYTLQAVQAKKAKASYRPCSLLFNVPKINFCNFYSRKTAAVEWI